MSIPGGTYQLHLKPVYLSYTGDLGKIHPKLIESTLESKHLHLQYLGLGTIYTDHPATHKSCKILV